MRVVIADDTALVRDGLARLLQDEGFDVCGRAHDGAELVAIVEESPPDAVVTDIRMPPTHTDEGLVAAAEIRARFPETSVLVLSQYVEIGYALRLIEGQEGHCGYLLKDRVTNASEIVDALNRVTSGEMVVDAELVAALLARPRSRDPLDELSEREREVLALMAEGLTDRGIAERLWLSTATVETHVRHILQKLSLSPSASSNRRVQAVLTYLRA
jgi:DNA-binding NarL/FixJ family response regulator